MVSSGRKPQGTSRLLSPVLVSTRTLCCFGNCRLQQLVGYRAESTSFLPKLGKGWVRAPFTPFMYHLGLLGWVMLALPC